jgi:hypothetical protein
LDAQVIDAMPRMHLTLAFGPFAEPEAKVETIAELLGGQVIGEPRPHTWAVDLAMPIAPGWFIAESRPATEVRSTLE